MKNLKFLLGALLVLGLVACGEKKEEEKPAEQPAATEQLLKLQKQKHQQKNQENQDLQKCLLLKQL